MSNPRLSGLLMLLLGVATMIGNTTDILPASAFWIGLAAYVVLLFARIRRVDRRLQGLERELGDRAPAQRSNDS